MILAAIGIYGVMSFLVTQGTADIAIRVALGARRASILSLVFRQGMGLALRGHRVGLVGALGLTRMMSSLLFGVTPTDPFTFFSVLALLLLVALSACLFPAGRAMRIDPMVRCEQSSGSPPQQPTPRSATPASSTPKAAPTSPASSLFPGYLSRQSRYWLSTPFPTPARRNPSPTAAKAPTNGPSPRAINGSSSIPPP
jgi:hypothetical protein